MARKLPWLIESAKTKKSTPNTYKSARRKQCDESSDDETTLRRSRVKEGKRVVGRNPSSSPPPAPPPEELMVDGLDGDDAWAMVEDEFLSTAKLYTQHLHHAEYQRMKKIAKARSASTMSSIMRPTDGKTPISVQTKKKIEGMAQRHENEKAVQNIGGVVSDSEADSLDEEDPWMRDPRLAGLMNTKEPSAKLGRLTGAQLSTRPSSSVQSVLTSRRRPRSPDESDEDDLDIASPRASTTSRALQSASMVEKASTSRIVHPMHCESDEEDLDSASRTKLLPSVARPAAPVARVGASTRERLARPILSTRTSPDPNAGQSRFKIVGDLAKTASKEVAPESDWHDLPKKSTLHPKLAEKLEKRKAEAAKLGSEKSKKQRRSSNVAEVPTFLF